MTKNYLITVAVALLSTTCESDSLGQADVLLEHLRDDDAEATREKD
jgi:hypothetical protein